MPPTVIKTCASQILRLAIRRFALEYTKNALGEKCVLIRLKVTDRCIRLNDQLLFMCFPRGYSHTGYKSLGENSYRVNGRLW